MGRRSQEEEVKIAALRNSETFSLLSATEMVEQIEVFLKHGLINEAIAKQRRLPPPLTTEQVSVYASLRANIAEHFARYGYYSGVLDVLQPYDTVPARARLPIKERTLVSLQLGKAYCVNSNYPSAISLLNESIKCSTQITDKNLEAQALCQLGVVYFNLQEYVIAQDNLSQALKIFTKNNDKKGEAESYLYTGKVLVGLRDFDKGIENYQKAIHLSADILEIDKENIQTQANVSLATVYFLQGKLKQAIDCYESLIRLYGDKQKFALAVQTYNGLAGSLILVGNWTRAEELLEKSLTLARKQQDDYGESLALAQYGLLYTLTGRINEAKPSLNFALELAQQIRAKDSESFCEVNLGKLYLLLGEKEQALLHLKPALETSLAINRIDYAVEAQLAFIEICLSENKLQQAQAGLKIARDWLGKEKNLLLIGKLLYYEARLAEKQGQESLTKLNQAIEIFEVCSLPLDKALCLIERAQVLQKNKDPKALADLERAQQLLQEIGATALVTQVNLLIKQLFSTNKAIDPNNLANQLLAERKQIQQIIRACSSRQEAFKQAAQVLQEQTQADLITFFELTTENPPKLLASTNELSLVTESLEGRFQTALAGKKSGWVGERSLEEPLYLALQPINEDQQLAVLFWGASRKAINKDLIQAFLEILVELTNLIAKQTEDRVEFDEVEIGKIKSFQNLPEFIFASRKMSELTDQINRIYSSSLTVLITGESGTGKDLIARAVHIASERRARPFSPFNCTATPQEIVEAQLFGYRKGAFTGANIDYEGVIRAAEGGTLLLDEIGDLSLNIQPKLLRFLQDGEIQPIGYTRPIKVNVRIIASTNRDLEKMVERGEFREDLYHRLNILRLYVPPLRQRREEIRLLAQYFLKESCQRTNKRLGFSSAVLNLIESYDWPGNVRQLKNEIERIVAFAGEKDTIEKYHLSQDILQATANIKIKGQVLEKHDLPEFQEGMSLDETLMQVEKQIIVKVLKQCRGNIRRTSTLLGISRKGLYDKIKRLKIRH